MIKLSFLNLFRKKSRTFLALLGIVIGVAAMLVLVSIVDGVFDEFNNVLSEFQGVIVYEKDAFDIILSEIDESLGGEIERIPGVKTAIGEIWFIPNSVDGVSSGFSNFTSAISIYGLDVQKQLAASDTGWFVEIEEGAKLKPGDIGWVVIGKGVADQFNKFVGSTIKINDEKFRIKGIFKAQSVFVENIIAMNLEDARNLTDFPSGKLTSFTVGLNDPSKDKQIANLIEFKHGDDVRAISMSAYSEEFGGIIGNFRLVVFFVAAISAVVAGIGIANTILMSIIERSKEIGSLKAVGWTNSNIIKMIMYESLAMGILGGIIGIMFGYSVDVLLEAQFGIPFLISPVLILEVFGFAVILGLIAGIYPAYRASKLDPIEAIRAG